VFDPFFASDNRIKRFLKYAERYKFMRWIPGMFRIWAKAIDTPFKKELHDFQEARGKCADT
jgi:hypothetical protein